MSGAASCSGRDDCSATEHAERAAEDPIARARFDAARGRHVWSDKALANISLVQAAMDRWRLQNDPAADHGLTMAEFVVLVLEQERRLR
jgi:hypothetical protein